MANWHYYNGSGEKIAVTGAQLKALALKGIITPDTMVETEEGKTAPARKVKGLTFAETAAPTDSSIDKVSDDAPSPFDISESSGIYGMSQNNSPKLQESYATVSPSGVTATSDNLSQSNYFFNDEDGVRRGPITEQRLRTLAERGTITPTTLLETDTGHKETAGQILGLKFNVAVPVTPNSGTATINKTLGTAYQTIRKPALWDWVLLDYRFRFFLTPILLKIIWCMWVIVVEVLIVMFIFVIFSSMLPSSTPEPENIPFGRPPAVPGSGGGSIGFLLVKIRLLLLVLIPLVAATFLLGLRIALESVMIVFRIGEHLKSIDEKT